MCIRQTELTAGKTRAAALNVETRCRVRFGLVQPYLGNRDGGRHQTAAYRTLHKSSAQAVAACATVRNHYQNYLGSFQPPPKHSEAISMAANGTRKGEVAPQYTPPPQQANVPQGPRPRQTTSPSF
jgi:hypothetical protein